MLDINVHSIPWFSLGCRFFLSQWERWHYLYLATLSLINPPSQIQLTNILIVRNLLLINFEIWVYIVTNFSINWFPDNGLVLQQFHLDEHTKHLTSKEDTHSHAAIKLTSSPKTWTHAIQWVDMTTLLCGGLHISSCGQNSQQNLGQKLYTGIVAKLLL